MGDLRALRTVVDGNLDMIRRLIPRMGEVEAAIRGLKSTTRVDVTRHKRCHECHRMAHEPEMLGIGGAYICPNCIPGSEYDRRAEARKAGEGE